ncbi:UBP-type zinc finger domain-containing protein [Kitasatospora sp. NPDC057015]|uniref:UBP-type zinc finger domain-containing protein n=1 Tax=Kitasatospora sp. NPDC057015 TaxID=3346001 RepID=UPI00362804AB
MDSGTAWQVAPAPGAFVQPVCGHLDEPRGGLPPAGRRGCEDCLRVGGTWVNLLQCLVCGHLGCCDSSKGKHAYAHAHAESGHDLARSLKRGEDWAWCYADEVFLRPAD